MDLHRGAITFILYKTSLDATFDFVPNTGIGVHARFLSPPRVSFGDPHDSGGVVIYGLSKLPIFSAFLPSHLAYHAPSLLEAQFLYSSTSFS